MKPALRAHGEVSRMHVVDDILAVLERRGHPCYVNGRLSHREHALLAASMAEEDAAPPALIVAALLHDVGHLLQGGPRDIAEMAVDTRHEEVGSRWLRRYFGPDITEPVRLHVAAKRYLCAAEDGYWEQLAPAAVRNLAAQGGPLSESEARRFEDHPFHHEAVWLRRIDDRATQPGARLPSVAHYRDCLEAVLLSIDD
jgi:predicted HD phosphohydrolase